MGRKFSGSVYSAAGMIQQEKFMEFVKQSNVYNTYYPMFTIMIGTGLRCGELIGLTWKDINIKAKTVNVDHQLIYKNLGDGCKFHISTPKTESGIRIIPMTQEVAKAFEEQRKINFMLAKDKSIESLLVLPCVITFIIPCADQHIIICHFQRNKWKK